MRFGSHHVISAVGVDSEGRKHVLGIQLGATENAAAVKDLLTRLRQKVRTDQRYLFVIDGAKALRAGIEEVFGSNQLVQRCRTISCATWLSGYQRATQCWRIRCG